MLNPIFIMYKRAADNGALSDLQAYYHALLAISHSSLSERADSIENLHIGTEDISQEEIDDTEEWYDRVKEEYEQTLR